MRELDGRPAKKARYNYAASNNSIDVRAKQLLFKNLRG